MDGLWAGKRKSILLDGANQSSEVGDMNIAYFSIKEKICIMRIYCLCWGWMVCNVMSPKMCSICHECCRGGREGKFLSFSCKVLVTFECDCAFESLKGCIQHILILYEQRKFSLPGTIVSWTPVWKLYMPPTYTFLTWSRNLIYQISPCSHFMISYNHSYRMWKVLVNSFNKYGVCTVIC